VILVHALEAETLEVSEAANPLVYHNRAWHALGDWSRLDD
jgi:hypothetical protein